MSKLPTAPVRPIPAPGVYWYRGSYARRDTGEVVRQGWEVVQVSPEGVRGLNHWRAGRKEWERMGLPPFPDEWVPIAPPAP
jgi:hypothetical protein